MSEEREKIFTEDLRKGIFPSKTKGRGINATESMEVEMEERYSGKGGVFDSLPVATGTDGDDQDGQPLKSVEGYIIFVANIQEEVQEPDIRDVFSEWGQIRNVHLNIDRRTGFTKGYALIEYQSKEEAEDAVKNGNGFELAGQKLDVGFAFISSSSSSGPVISVNRSISSASSSYRNKNGGYRGGDRDSKKKYSGKRY
ncbi:hypothetical protein CYY_005707 [Polysphondylium violaceum]|uniref:RRM domain-containing protein n=1 Tax=Polysphondylium violaceum TaxID=133409 RepID=A0A8J4PT12_9MYCE|nr:hypothetical protein CYY_005707 [Polysphondylium violaceum]